MSRHFLGIDSGSSATKWALVDESGKEIKRGKSISVDGHLYREESRINWAKLLDELLHELPDPIVAIYAGVTGASDSVTGQMCLIPMECIYMPALVR
jgi:N-acetylglucosamine kinase-like BadF-type ATPase